MHSLWDWLSQPSNQQTLGWIGTSVAAFAAAVWGVVKAFRIDQLNYWKINTSAYRPFIRRTTFRYFTVDALRRQESGISDGQRGGELQFPTHVYVNASQPVEGTQYEYATQVMENIKCGAHYYYVFTINPTHNGEYIADMMIKLASASGSESTDIAKRKRDRLLGGDYLRIHMVEESYGFEYCVLNANNTQGRAHCYLRLPFDTETKRGWIDWCSGDAAFKIARRVEDLCLNVDAEKRRIIKSTQGCQVYADHKLSNDFRRTLKNAIEDRAGVLAEKLIVSCIGNEETSSANKIGWTNVVIANGAQCQGEWRLSVDDKPPLSGHGKTTALLDLMEGTHCLLVQGKIGEKDVSAKKHFTVETGNTTEVELKLA